MVSDTIRTWLSNHPRVLSALFVGMIYLSHGIDAVTTGSGGTYSGP